MWMNNGAGKYAVNWRHETDRSNRFGLGKQFGDFGSVGEAWMFSKERSIGCMPLFWVLESSGGEYRIAYTNTCIFLLAYPPAPNCRQKRTSPYIYRKLAFVSNSRPDFSNSNKRWKYKRMKSDGRAQQKATSIIIFTCWVVKFLTRALSKYYFRLACCKFRFVKPPIA